VEKIFGMGGERTHLPGGHVEKMKSVRGTVGEAAAGERALLEDGDGQGPGAAQQLHREHGSAESASDNQNVDLRTGQEELPRMPINIIDIIAK
jgi:hypothetical protein